MSGSSQIPKVLPVSPLRNTPSTTKPSSLYHSPHLEGAERNLVSALRNYQGLVLLTGTSGVGKTTLLQRCMNEERTIIWIALTGEPSLDFLTIINHLCSKLDVYAISDASQAQLQALLETLALNAAAQQPTALVIDDAHLLAASVIQQLHAFMETPLFPEQRLQIVLAGAPQLAEQLRQLQLLGNVTTHCQLPTLNTAEATTFIYHSFAVSNDNYGQLVPTPAVVEAIASYCDGRLRTLALLCDAVLLSAGLGHDADLTPVLVDEAARNCFLSKTGAATLSASVGSSAAAACGTDPLSVGFPDLGLHFDFDLEQTVTTDDDGFSLQLLDAVTPPPSDPQLASAAVAAPSPDAAAPSPPMSAAAQWFAALLADVECKQERKESALRNALQNFHDHYMQLLDTGHSSLQHIAFEQRLAKLQVSEQPLLLSMAAPLHSAPGELVALTLLLLNPSWWMYRVIQVRVRGDAVRSATSATAIRLLDGHDAWVITCSLQRLQNAPLLLWLEVELCDHRGQWSAYANQQEIRLTFQEDSAAASMIGGERFWPSSAAGDAAAAQAWQYTLPLELELYAEQTQQLRAQYPQTLNRGTPLTRALLLAANPAQAPVRIELASRPLLVLGRQSSTNGSGIGDFTLGFVPKYSRISRLHCAICALGDQLLVLALSDQGSTYTGCADQRLPVGEWVMLEPDAAIDICGLYQLRLSLAWDGEPEDLEWDAQPARERFGHYLMDLVEVLHQRDQHTDNDALRTNIRSRYLHLLHMQERVSELNGVGTAGTLLYARFQRDDAAARQIVHYYIPKWLSIGSAPSAGLRLNGAGVQAQHAELMFREGCYWLRNLGEAGSVRVGCHGLATNEVLSLTLGDSVAIGEVCFQFEEL